MASSKTRVNKWVLRQAGGVGDSESLWTVGLSFLATHRRGHKCGSGALGVKG